MHKMKELVELFGNKDSDYAGGRWTGKKGSSTP